MSKPVIGFAGMTHLGLISSVAGAEKGFPVICFDPNPKQIATLQRQELTVVEPDLPELFAQNQDHLTFTAVVADLNRCDIVYVAQDVPTDDLGQSDLGPINHLINMIDKVIRPDVIMIILSQVPPGFSRDCLSSGRLLYYQVETLIFGQAVERALHPERFIVGCADPVKSFPPFYAQYLAAFNCPILPMRYESAELAKISINICLVASISAANTLAEICEKIGADWSEIIPALRLDRRIGRYSYIVPGLGISGGNLERDLHSVFHLSEKHDTDGGIIASWLNNSKRRKNWPFEILKQKILTQNPEATIAVLGLAYKENTNSTKNSAALLLIEKLSNCTIKAYDPVVDACILGHHVSGVSSVLEAANGADAVAIMTPWSEFREITVDSLAQCMSGRVVIDPYRVLDGKMLRAKGFTYATLGETLRG